MVSYSLLDNSMPFPKNLNLGEVPHEWKAIEAFLKYLLPSSVLPKAWFFSFHSGIYFLT